MYNPRGVLGVSANASPEEVCVCMIRVDYLKDCISQKASSTTNLSY